VIDRFIPVRLRFDAILAASCSILLLEGDAEHRLLTDAEVAIQSVFPDREVQFARQWSTRPDWLGPAASAPVDFPLRSAVLPGADVGELLEKPHRLVIFALLPAVAQPALRHRSGAAFLAHQGLRASWSPETAAVVAAECSEELPISAHEAALALEPVIERLQARGSAVAVSTAFRHVKGPMEHRAREGKPGLRELVRRSNLEAARLSRRTGCFVLDFDCPLAQEGGASVDADCFGGDGRAAEIALDQFAALLLDAMPDDFMPSEVA
jgi:hypothetical protein